MAVINVLVQLAVIFRTPEPDKIPRRDAKDHAHARDVSGSDLDEDWILRWDVVDTNENSAIGIGVPQYAGLTIADL